MRNEDKERMPDAPAPESDGQEQSREGLSRRRFTLAGISIPAIAVLANRPAFGSSNATCNPSGYISFHADNVSGAHHIEEGGCGGWSPGAWRNPYAGNGDGGYRFWRDADSLPHHPDGAMDTGGGNNYRAVIEDYPDANQYEATLFDAALDYSFDSDLTLHEAMLGYPGSLEFHASAVYLNAKLNENTGAFPGYMSVADVRAVYASAKTGTVQYTSAGNEILFSEAQAKAFFEQTYH